MIEEKKHAKYSASGSDIWLNCPGSVKLSEGQPNITSKYAEEGTKAHELVEQHLRQAVEKGKKTKFKPDKKYPLDMKLAVKTATDFILDHWNEDGEELLIEKKVSLEFIHEGMFGTVDVGVVEHFGKLQVWDYKHGAGHPVNVTTQIRGTTSYILNSQLAYYALGLLHEYNYDFEEVLIGIIQPRAQHKLGPIRYETFKVEEIKQHEYIFKKGIERCLKPTPKLYLGSHCQWCKAYKVCPLQQNKRSAAVVDMFEDDLGF